MTTAPLPLSSAAAAPVLEYHAPAAAPTGVHVERTGAGLTIYHYPPRLGADVKRAAVSALLWGVGGFSLVSWPMLVIAIDFPSTSAAALVFCVALLASLPLDVAMGTGVMLAFRATVRYEVSAGELVVTVRGFRLYYRDAFRRADVVRVHDSRLGLRIDRRGRRRGDWVPCNVGTERAQICGLLREELSLAGPPATT